MRFTKIMCAAGAVGIVGALALGSATAANAAPAPKASTAEQGDRVQGPFNTWSNKQEAVWNAWGQPASGGAMFWTDQQYPPTTKPLGALYTFPAPSSGYGPISPANNPDLCMTGTGNAYGPGNTGFANAVYLQPCNGSNSQQWEILSAGTIVNAQGYRVSDLHGGRTMWGLPAVENGSMDEQLVLSLLSPIVDIADLSASVVSKDQDAKSAVIGGKGEPGADLTITNPDGSEQTVKVNEDGTWTATIPNLTTGDNSVKVKQTVGDNVQEKDLTITMDEAPLTADVISINPDDQSALIGGDAEPGAELVITNPDGSKQTITVPDSGKWEATIPGLKEGDNPVRVEQTVGDSTQTKDLVVTLLPSPIVNPAIAGGAGLAAMAALGTAIMIRRNKARA